MHVFVTAASFLCYALLYPVLWLASTPDRKGKICHFREIPLKLSTNGLGFFYLHLLVLKWCKIHADNSPSCFYQSSKFSNKENQIVKVQDLISCSLNVLGSYPKC